MTRNNKRSTAARGKAASRKNDSEKKSVFNCEGWGISNAREWDDNITFTLSVPGAYFSLSLRQSRSGDWFIFEPARKGSDGNYYRYFTLYLSDSDKEAIIKAVLDELGIGEDDADMPF